MTIASIVLVVFVGIVGIAFTIFMVIAAVDCESKGAQLRMEGTDA